MPIFYALTRADADSGYDVYGKGEDVESAEAEALRNIEAMAEQDPEDEEAAALRTNLRVMTRAEAEEEGLVKPGAPVIWYLELRRYKVEDHGAPATGPKPTGITSR